MDLLSHRQPQPTDGPLTSFPSRNSAKVRSPEKTHGGRPTRTKTVLVPFKPRIPLTALKLHYAVNHQVDWYPKQRASREEHALSHRYIYVFAHS